MMLVMAMTDVTDDDDDGDGYVFMMTVMMMIMVLIYFWYISNIFSWCTLLSAPKPLNVKNKEQRDCNETFIKVSEPAQVSSRRLIIIAVFN